MKTNLVRYKKGQHSWIRVIKNRIDDNLNFLSITTGATGSGKSFANLSMAYLIDEDFNPTKQVCFSFIEFMKAVKGFNGEDKELSKKKYKVLIFDEIQVSINKHKWASKINRLFLYLISTFRHRNIIVFFNSPYEDFVDSNTMKLLHTKFSTLGWDKKSKQSSIRARFLQYNGSKSKFYTHCLFVIKDGRAQKFSGAWGVPIPPKHLIIPYEKKKTAFTNKLNATIERELEIMQQEQEQTLEVKDKRKPLTDIQRETMKVVSNHKYKKGSEILGKSMGTLHQSVQESIKKGYNLEEFKEITKEK